MQCPAWCAAMMLEENEHDQACCRRGAVPATARCTPAQSGQKH
ncbi:hypothetical protein ASZ90_010770 [hydrocarbon metagenome]|uniref:Uncharacterized protein n=1 Tax=hydrocarbon metagenome TaxID=938273 RepID=A0A0W8FF50_9ZZZZ